MPMDAVRFTVKGATMRHTIKLYRTAQGWMALHSDPSVREIMGTDTIPTAYTAQATAARVAAEIAKRNPQCDVILATD